MERMDPYVFDPPRPNFEIKQLGIRLACALGFAGYGLVTTMPPMPFYAVSMAFATMALLKTGPAYRRLRKDLALAGKPTVCCTFEDLKDRCRKHGHEKDMWLGIGYHWTQANCQKTAELLKMDNLHEIVHSCTGYIRYWRYLRKHGLHLLAHPWLEMKRINSARERITDDMGVPWIHGTSPDESDLYQPLKHTDGHTLIVGTTGSGKTRCFDLLISQAILRGESVIILDPKGDEELMNNARLACAKLGRESSFISFHPAHKKDSAHIDFLDSWSDPSEVASRIANLIQVSGQGQTFKDFAWDALNKVCQAMVVCYDKPTLLKLRHYLEGDLTGIAVKTLSAWILKHHGEAELKRVVDNKAAFAGKNMPQDDVLAVALIAHYKANGPDSPVMDGIVSLYQHNREHFGKMITTLLPILSMLTSGDVGELLSPRGGDNDPVDNSNLFTTTLEMMEGCYVVYIGLNNLANAQVGSAIGSLALSTLASDAGNRYNFTSDKPPTNIFVDEASEIVNESFIQILNKGRGAHFRLFVATQTFSDFAARLGSKDKALQVLGNLNNMISLRCIDPQTQEFVCERFPKTKIRSVTHSQAVSVSADDMTAKAGNISEQLKEEESDLFPQELLGMLPNLEFIACLSGGIVIKGRYPVLVPDRSKFKA